MQKAAIFTALVATVGLAIYAYPSGDKRSAAFFAKTAMPADRDGPAPTPLDKLKAATGRADSHAPEQHAVPPPPRVMESVRQELQSRPASTATAPAGTTVPAPHLAASTSNKVVADDKAIEKLAARLPATSAAQANATATQTAVAPPAALHAATLVLPASSASTATASGAIPQRVSAADAAPAAPALKSIGEAPAAKDRAAAPPKAERKRVTHRASIAHNRGSSGEVVVRSAQNQSAFKRNDGM